MSDYGPVLITGATGFVGAAVLDELRATGRRVRALTRTEEGERRLSALGAAPVRGDIMELDGLISAAQGCDVIYHVAGVNAFCLPDPAPLYRTNVDGTRNVVRAAVAAGVRRVVYTSSAATIGEEHGTVGREDSPHRGNFLSHYERSKWEAEQVAFEEADRAALELVAVNPSSVQGPGRVKGTAKLLIGYLNGTLRGLIDSRMSVLDIADCARGHVLAATHGVPGNRYILSGATLTVREAVELMGRVAGLTEEPRVLPPWAAVGIGKAVGTVGRLRNRKAPLCDEMMRTLLHGHAYDGERAHRELGLDYTPIEDTLRRTLAWYVEQGVVTRPLPAFSSPISGQV
jgi:dihydroflavonol-4-reductase